MEGSRDISEFWVPKFEGEKIKIVELVDKDVVILDFEIRPSQYYENKSYVVVQIEYEGNKRVFTTTAAAVIGSLKWLKERGAFPGQVRTKIIQELSPKGRKQYKLASTSGVKVEKLEE